MAAAFALILIHRPRQMTPETTQKLVTLNQRFYAQFAGAFHRSRLEPAEGFHDLVAFLPERAFRVLDIGCGNGRFGYFLHQHGRVQTYLGLDASPEYLAQAQQASDLLPHTAVPPTPGQFRFQLADMTQPDFLRQALLSATPTAVTFDLIVCLSALHHIPGQARRQAIMQEMANHLTPGGLLILGNWQFLDSARQRRKIIPWAEAGTNLTPTELAELTEADYLLSWNRGGTGFRYVAMIDETATAVLATHANLHIIHQFRSDGREKNLNLYTIFSNEC